MVLRGQPGNPRIPACDNSTVEGGTVVHHFSPCFSDPQRKKRFGSKVATLYTSNQGADQWHLLYAWRARRLSLHVVAARDAAVHVQAGRRQSRSNDAHASSASSRKLSPTPEMRLTRRQLVGGAAASALGAAGIYELADRLGSAPARVSAGPRPPEQHLLDGIRVVTDNDVEVLVPPLHHEVVTATLRGRGDSGRSPRCSRVARTGVDRTRRALRADAGRVGSDGGLGAAVLRSLCPGSGCEAPPGRSPCVSNETARGTRARGRDPLPERSRPDMILE